MLAGSWASTFDLVSNSHIENGHGRCIAQFEQAILDLIDPDAVLVVDKELRVGHKFILPQARVSRIVRTLAEISPACCCRCCCARTLESRCDKLNRIGAMPTILALLMRLDITCDAWDCGSRGWWAESSRIPVVGGACAVCPEVLVGAEWGPSSHK